MPKNSGYSMKPKRVGSAAEDAAKQRQKLKNALNVARKSPAGQAAAKRKKSK